MRGGKVAFTIRRTEREGGKEGNTLVRSLGEKGRSKLFMGRWEKMSASG